MKLKLKITRSFILDLQQNLAKTPSSISYPLFSSYKVEIFFTNGCVSNHNLDILFKTIIFKLWSRNLLMCSNLSLLVLEIISIFHISNKEVPHMV